MVIDEPFYGLLEGNMKSITIHHLEPNLANLIEREAEKSGLSLNKTIKKILMSALGLSRGEALSRRKNFEDLCGLWSKSDADTFKKSSEMFERIDPEDWK